MLRRACLKRRRAGFQIIFTGPQILHSIHAYPAALSTSYRRKHYNFKGKNSIICKLFCFDTIMYGVAGLMVEIWQKIPITVRLLLTMSVICVIFCSFQNIFLRFCDVLYCFFSLFSVCLLVFGFFLGLFSVPHIISLYYCVPMFYFH